MEDKLDKNICPRCRANLIPTKSLNGSDSIFWKECSNPFCGTMVDTYKPTIMQHNFIKDSHKFKGTFGGFGSGKSKAVLEDVMKHILITPNAYVAVIGYTFRQIKRNFKKDFDENTPEVFMLSDKNQKTPGYNSTDNIYTFKNGAKIELITADEEGKIRGLNATKVVVLEASNVAWKIVETAKSRMRNRNASAPKLDKDGKPVLEFDQETGEWVPAIKTSWINMTFESNPDAALLKNFLLKCSRVQFYGSSYNKYNYLLDKIDDEYSAHISASDSNPYLPPNYVRDNTKNMPIHEAKRFYYGSFLFSENMVYPRVYEAIVDPYPINFEDKDIFVTIGYDYGLSDTSAFTFGAVNFRTNTLVIYDELGVTDMDVKEIATEYRKKLAVIPEGKLLFVPKMDAKSYSKRGGDKRSIGTLFEEVGLLFEPIQEGPDVRTMKLNSLINNGQFQIFRTCTRLIEEITQYKFITNSKGDVTNKRTDKRNHFIDSVEFMTIPLPFNLEKMTIAQYIRPGERIIADKLRKAKEIRETPQQSFVRQLDPLGMGSSSHYHMPSMEDYNKGYNDYDEEEIDDIISRLSGI